MGWATGQKPASKEFLKTVDKAVRFFVQESREGKPELWRQMALREAIRWDAYRMHMRVFRSEEWDPIRDRQK